jgi:hypothetical protein
MDIRPFDAVAVVRDERVVAVRSGRARAHGTVNLEDVEIAHRTLDFPLTAQLALHAPIRRH